VSERRLIRDGEPPVKVSRKLTADRKIGWFHAQPTAFYDGIMTWERDGSSLEIRTQDQLRDGRPALDEIVANGASVHLEQMSHDHWWMGLEAGGKDLHLNFGVQNGRLWVHLCDQGDENTESEGDNRERQIPGIEE
jgi:hypothetical protein